MGLFHTDQTKEPVILKRDSSAEEGLSQMEKLLPEITDPKMKASLEKDIAAVKAGICGENKILFELENSHMPLYVIHDLYLEFEGLSAQIDFLVITSKLTFVIECKNLYGNITINQSGDFIRTRGNLKEGIYSPITQGKRHLDLMKQIRSANQKSKFRSALTERFFNSWYRPIVVLTNNKTILNAKYAPKEIRNQVIRVDHLIEYIKKVNDQSDMPVSKQNEMAEFAESFMKMHCENKTDYLEKYRTTAASTLELKDMPSVKKEEIPAEQTAPSVPIKEASAEAPLCPKCGASMVKRHATKGKNAGSEFWGCSRYPHCHGIVKIEPQE